MDSIRIIPSSELQAVSSRLELLVIPAKKSSGEIKVNLAALSQQSATFRLWVFAGGGRPWCLSEVRSVCDGRSPTL